MRNEGRRNILYFATAVEAETTAGAIGWAVAGPIRAHLESAGARVGTLEPYWDGVRFSCRMGLPTFQLRLTPYFEATPMEWSVEVVPQSYWRYLGPFISAARERVCRALDEFFATDSRYVARVWQWLPL